MTGLRGWNFSKSVTGRGFFKVKLLYKPNIIKWNSNKPRESMCFCDITCLPRFSREMLDSQNNKYLWCSCKNRYFFYFDQYSQHFTDDKDGTKQDANQYMECFRWDFFMCFIHIAEFSWLLLSYLFNFNSIQDEGRQKSLYHFFPCNFYKRTN